MFWGPYANGIYGIVDDTALPMFEISLFCVGSSFVYI